MLNERGERLMIRRTDNNFYALPAGNLELGEKLGQAVNGSIEDWCKKATNRLARARTCPR